MGGTPAFPVVVLGGLLVGVAGAAGVAGVAGVVTIVGDVGGRTVVLRLSCFNWESSASFISFKFSWKKSKKQPR